MILSLITSMWIISGIPVPIQMIIQSYPRYKKIFIYSDNTKNINEHKLLAYN